jgi:hypothetical protein
VSRPKKTIHAKEEKMSEKKVENIVKGEKV